MNYKKVLGIMLAVGVAGLIVSMLFDYSEKIGVCDYKNLDCRGLLDVIAGPLFIGSIVLSIVFLILFFQSETIFNSWKKFAMIFVPLSVVLIYFLPVYSSDWMFPIEKENTTMFLAVVYTVVSLGIIGRGGWKRNA